MKILEKKTKWTGAGCALALMAGAPAMADDTELLLVSPNPTNLPQPNIMFILDSSGSMDTEEETTKSYDHTESYPTSPGGCDPNAVYWSETDVLPDCSTSTQWVYKSNFHCAYADRQLDGVGTFTNTMVQFRQGTGILGGLLGYERWDYLEPGNHTGAVECLSDSGTHGDGTVGEVYASAVGTASAKWTSNSNLEVSWGSAPRNLSYTVYDGNYLNYKANPELVDLERTDIMKIVTKSVLDSIQNVNVGVMRFKGSDGGTVIEAIKDLDSNRAAINTTIDNIPASGNTPLAETLYESALYWTGNALDYGDTSITDPAALSAGNVYVQPALQSCAKNYNVLITDGNPVSDQDGPSKVGNLPAWSTTVTNPACTTTSGNGACLPDISEYLGKIDTANNVAGVQTVTTHTIGFTIDLPILKDTAEASGGSYFLADDIESLTVALLQIVADINDRSLSFTAPAVSVNSFNRTRNLNDIYLTMFGARTKTHWPGNLKKYGIDGDSIIDADGNDAVDPTTGFFYDTARSYWTVGGDDGSDVELGGAARRLPIPANRNLYTNNSLGNLAANGNALSTGNSGAYSLSDFGLTGAAGEPTLDEMIDWMRGVDVRDEDNNSATTVRYAMGDPLHSRPAAIVYGGTEANPDIVVYTATNDGYIHAINGSTGVELWSFVPKQLLPNMARLYFDPNAKYKQYGVDGDIVPIIKDVDGDGTIESSDGDYVRIVVGMRRGGNAYYALDVTSKTAPSLMWIKTLDSAGQSWSPPVITRMNITGTSINNDKAVVVVGGGYDPVHDTSTHPSTADGSGAGIHILDLVTGNTLWRAGPDSGATKRFEPGSSARPFAMTRSFATQIRVIDLNADGFGDRMYAADMGGQIWRFDVANGQTPANLVNGGVIARLGAEGLSSPTAAATRRFYNSPDVSIFRDPLQGLRYMAVSIGSGYRAHPFDASASDRFFSVRDPAVFNALTQTAYDNYDIIEDSDLVEVSGSVKNVIPTSAKGWKFTLPANEKVLADSITFNNEVFFVGFDPMLVNAVNCGTGQGTNFLYRVSIINGDPIVTNLDAITPGMEDDARRSQLAQGGIAPTPTILFPSPTDPNCTGDACSPPPIMCVGVECSSPGFDNNPVRTLWTQDGVN